MSKNRLLVLWARLLPHGNWMKVQGRPAQTLQRLVAVPDGFTSSEAGPFGCGLRTSDYIHRLRHMGFLIETIAETVEDGSRIGRYRLCERVELRDMHPEEKDAE